MIAPEPAVDVIDEIVGGFRVKAVPALVRVMPVNSYNTR